MNSESIVVELRDVKRVVSLGPDKKNQAVHTSCVSH